ncbi:MAG: nitronate monooxygenase [Mycobacteriaceae bacterium]|nr:nitronate monooxygenase [Mycobacteriaceae bacterium]
MSTTAPFSTRLTDFFGVRHPILLAPMDQVAGGRLAAAVTTAGGLGIIGGGYGDLEWLLRQCDAAQGVRFGVGFITWSMARNPELLDIALARQPETIFLSFGAPAVFVDRIHQANVSLTCQVHTREQARQALDSGADVLVAQGSEAGGHGMSARSTFTLVPEVVDLVAQRSAQIPVVAAGGVADGRGLAAALALGADGVLLGTRFWACQEALVTPQAHQRALHAGGDDTIRTQVYDIVRQRDWPTGYDARLISNALIKAWHGKEAELLAHLPEAVSDFQRAVAAQDYDVITPLVGEAIGLISRIRSAAEIVAEMIGDAARILNR